PDPRARGGRPAEQPAEELPRDDAERRDRRGVHRESFTPADDEADARAERFTRIDILAARPGMARGELGEAQRAKEGEHAAEQPGDEREPRAAELVGDETRRPKDPGANRDADDHREAVEQAKRLPQRRHGPNGAAGS